MKPSIHTMGEVLEININSSITSCIVISNKTDRHQLIVGEPVLVFMRSTWYVKPRHKNDLVKQSHFLMRYSLEVLFDCYALLYGDQKIWLEYEF